MQRAKPDCAIVIIVSVDSFWVAHCDLQTVSYGPNVQKMTAYD